MQKDDSDDKKPDETQKSKDKNFELIYSPRTTYSLELEYDEILFNDLTLNFDPITIKIIKKHFKERLGSLNKIEFISILKNHLLSWHPNLKDRTNKLMKLLARLFSEIDLNDNGSMEWAEFCNYIIHNSNSSGKNDNNAYRLRFYQQSRSVIDTRDYKENISYSFYLEKYNILGVVEEGKSNIRFYDAVTLKLMKVTFDLKDIQADIDRLEDKKLDDEIKLKNIERQKKSKKDKNQRQETEENAELSDEKSSEKNKNKFSNKTNKNHDKDKKKSVTVAANRGRLTTLNTIFIPEYDILLVSATNKKISAWKFSNGEFSNANNLKGFSNDKNYFTCAILMSSSPQYRLAWDSLHRFLYTGQSDGKVFKWDLSKSNPIGCLDIHKIIVKDVKTNTEDGQLRTQSEGKSSGTKKTDKKGDENKKTQDSVSHILLINKIQVLAASYLNGQIILWDTLLMVFRKRYHDHETGIYHMTYDNSKNLLFSCGFDHVIYVYDPYIEFPVYKLNGHNWSVPYMICNEKENELISIDIYGNAKFWDTKNLVCFQTIALKENTENNKNNASKNSFKMVYLKKQKKIMFYGTRLVIFETDKSLNPNLADDQIIFACLNDKIAKLFICFCLRKIKIWNPFTGKVQKVYEDPMENEITAFAIDTNLKRTFLGDNTGKLKCFNMKNGKELKTLEEHKFEINILVHSLELNIIVSCSVDNVVKIHDDRELNESEVLKEIRPGNNVKSIIIMESLKRIVIGLSTGIIRFYDFDHFRYDSDSILESTNEDMDVTCLYAFKDKEIIFSAHVSGLCQIMFTPPNTLKFYPIFSFKSIDEKEKEKGKIEISSITCVTYDYDNFRLFVGDQRGIIKCFNLKEIFDIVDEYEASKDKDKNIIAKTQEIKDNLLWWTEGHKEAIKHIHYTNIEPNLIISTSHDLKVKMFLADSGNYIDELKQIANKYNSVPIGIIYRGEDPITKIPNEKTVWRKELGGTKLQNVDEIDSHNIAEYSNKITIYNAKEKLLSYCKNVHVGIEQSNNWNFNVDVEKVKKEEDDNFKSILEEVKKKEVIIVETEKIMQKVSLYDDNYKPLFISEMEENDIKEFSKNISQKLRHIKLAISKSTLGQNKYSGVDEKEKQKEKDKEKEKEKEKEREREKEAKAKENELKKQSTTNSKPGALKNRKKQQLNNINFSVKDLTPSQFFKQAEGVFDELKKEVDDLLKNKPKLPPLNKSVTKSFDNN